MYGYLDAISKEWTEGVLAEIFRRCATNNTPGILIFSFFFF
jgi:hypothetical protein